MAEPGLSRLELPWFPTSWPEVKDQVREGLVRALRGQPGSGLRLGSIVGEDLVSGKLRPWAPLTDPIPQYGDRQGAIERALPLAGMAMTGAMPFAQKNALGIFGGRMAATADQSALRKAEEMAAKGAPREDIWNSTGWFQGADGKWRFEIPDDKTNFNLGSMADKRYKIFGNEIIAKEGTTSGMLNHPELWSAYPDKQFMQVGELRDPWAKGVYHPPGAGGPEMMAIDITGPTPHSTMLHELQHSVQNAEGFHPGGNPKYAEKIANPDLTRYREALINEPDLARYKQLSKSPEMQKELDAQNAIWRQKYQPRLDEIEKKALTGGRGEWAKHKPEMDAVFAEANKEFKSLFPINAETDRLYKSLTERGIPTREPPPHLDPHDVYRRLAGEVEARTVQKRMDLTPDQRRARYPWLDYDVPVEQQIIR